MDEPRYARILDTRLEAVSENQICYGLKEVSAVTSFVPLQSSSQSVPPEKEKSKKVLVFDLGGGTFDVSIHQNLFPPCVYGGKTYMV